MKGPATDIAAALRESLGLMGRSLSSWALPVVLLAWVAALPEALAARHLEEILGMIIGPYGIDLELAGGVAYAAALAVCLKLLLNLVALQWAFTVLADVAADRPVSLTGGLQRMVSWKLQFSWLVSGVVVSTGTSLWYLGGCMLLLPFGFAVAEAYEQQNGMAAIGVSARLGFTRGPTGSWLGLPMVLVSTGVLFAAAVVSCGSGAVDSWFSTEPSLDELLPLLQDVDPTRPESLIGGLLPVLFPTPSWPATIATILMAPARQLVEVSLLAIQLVAYHHARKVAAAPPG